MITDTIYFPSDVTITVNVKQGDGTAYDLSDNDIEDVELILYQEKNRIIQEFKSNANQIDDTDFATGVVVVVLDRLNSDDCIDGVLFGQIKITKTNADLADSKEIIVVGDIEIGVMKKSIE